MFSMIDLLFNVGSTKAVFPPICMDLVCRIIIIFKLATRSASISLLINDRLLSSFKFDASVVWPSHLATAAKSEGDLDAGVPVMPQRNGAIAHFFCGSPT